MRDARTKEGNKGRLKLNRYALNLLDIVDRGTYPAYSRRSAREVAAHGGKLVALGRFREAQKGDIAPRQVLNLVEWESRDAFQHCLDDPWGFEPPSGAIAILDEGNMGVRPRVRVVEIAGDFRIYGSGVANGIQEAGGKIPIRSTRKTKGFRRDPEALFKFMSRIVL